MHLWELTLFLLCCIWNHCSSSLQAKFFSITIVGRCETSYSYLLSLRNILFFSPLHFYSWSPKTISYYLEDHVPFSCVSFGLFIKCLFTMKRQHFGLRHKFVKITCFSIVDTLLYCSCILFLLFWHCSCLLLPLSCTLRTRFASHFCIPLFETHS